jgi:uncharacterized protein DUF397
MDIGHVTWHKSSYSGSDGGNCVEVGVWHKASHSTSQGGGCVEVGLWHKTSYSGSNGGACVEVTRTPEAVVAVRDSKDPDGPRLGFTPADWRAFTGRVKDGQFDLAL